MTVDPLQFIESTGEPAFAVDERGRVVIWNKAAEALLGYGAHRVLGRPCHDVICGLDSHGNRFCDEDCNLHKMVRRKEQINGFSLRIRLANGSQATTHVTSLMVRGPKSGQYTLVHILRPIDEDRQAATLPPSSRGAVENPPASAVAPPSQSTDAALTPRETEVLRLLADGVSSSEIADRLYISVTTVRTHVQRILRKLDAHSQLQAVSIALHLRLI